MKLTKKAIDGFAYRGGWDVRWDDQVSGFGIRLYPSGRKSFVYSYRHQGRKRLLVLGGYGDITVDQGRGLAREAAYKVAKGGDPLEERRGNSRQTTFGELCTTYLERHAKRRKRSWAEDEARIKRHLPMSWQMRPLASITRAEIVALHNKVGKTRPYEANRVLALLHTIFERALAWEMLDEGQGNPAGRVERFPEVSRKRYASEREIERLARAIDHEPSLFVRSLIWLYLLTGARKNELMQARWDQVDWEREILNLPSTKSGEPQIIPLSKASMGILQAIPCLEDNPHIFPGARKGQHLVNISKNWKRIRAAAEVPDLRIHDLRRTVGSWMTQQGVDLNAIKSALRHQEISTTLVYARLGEDPGRSALERHGERVLEVTGRARDVG